MSFFKKKTSDPVSGQASLDRRVIAPDEPEIYPSSIEDYSPESHLPDEVLKSLWHYSLNCPLTYGQEGRIKHAAEYNGAVARSVYAIKMEVRQESRAYHPKEGLLSRARKKIGEFIHRHDNPQP
ncbi:MAG TPA: hypothetical protein VJC07_02235 [Candidatus Nanoarchaeia archaeon]|nr:hypothetical protein [Candidatus Nanoarchaeia archaeon]